MASPDGRFTAWAQGYEHINPLRSDFREKYVELTVTSLSSQGPRKNLVARVVIQPPNVPELAQVRSNPQLIQWSSNSQQVSFKCPEISIAITVVRMFR